MTADFQPTQPPAPERLVVQGANLEGFVVGEEDYRRGLDRLLETDEARLRAAVRAITSRGTDLEGQDRIRRVVELDISLQPDQIPSMLDAVHEAAKRQAERKDARRRLFHRAASVDLPRHWLSLAGLPLQPTDNEAARMVWTDTERRRKGLPPDTMLRRFGKRAVNFAKERGLL